MTMDDDAAFDELARSLNPPMVIVTTAAATAAEGDGDGERGGCLVGFHSQSSIEPRRYAVWLSKANHTYRVAVRATTFAVHFLSVDDLELAERFGTLTGDEVDKFAGLDVTVVHGVPVLDALPNHLVVTKVAVLDDGGDHVCVSTSPVEASSTGSFQPLRLLDVEHLTPGHEADEDGG